MLVPGPHCRRAAAPLHWHRGRWRCPGMAAAGPCCRRRHLARPAQSRLETRRRRCRSGPGPDRRVLREASRPRPVGSWRPRLCRRRSNRCSRRRLRLSSSWRPTASTVWPAESSRAAVQAPERSRVEARAPAAEREPVPAEEVRQVGAPELLVARTPVERAPDRGCRHRVTEPRRAWERPPRRPGPSRERTRRARALQRQDGPPVRVPPRCRPIITFGQDAEPGRPGQSVSRRSRDGRDERPRGLWAAR